MRKENFTILFVIKLTKLNGKGLYPVNVHITYQGVGKENAIGTL
jgi:hypothetical protein